MPGKKKYQPRQVCTSASRRILQTVAIKDLPQVGIFCVPNSQAPSPSVSQPCICDQEDCAPGVCCDQHHQCKPNNEPQSTQQQQTATCAPKCKGLNETIIDNMPCCQDMLRAIAQEACNAFQSDFSPLDKRVSIQDPNSQNVDPIPDCCKPATSMPECSMQDGTTAKSAPDSPTIPKKDSCCENCNNSRVSVVPNTPIGARLNKSSYQLKPGVQQQNDDCSVENCARGASSVEKSGSSQSASTQSEDTSAGTHKQSSSEGTTTPQLQAKPTTSPIQSRKASGTIANNSFQKIFARLSKNNIKDPNASEVNVGKTIDERESKKGNKAVGKKNSSFQKLFGRFGKNSEKNIPSTESVIESDCSCVIKQGENEIKAEKKKLAKVESKKLSKEESKKDMTMVKKTKENKKDKPISLTRPCGKPSCSVNTCTCHFPPAYSQYFECTGRISGNCNCDQNK